MRRLRGISLGAQALVILSIAIAVAIAVGGIILAQTRTMASKGATLSLVIDAHDAGEGYTSITVTIKNNGPESIRVTNITLYVNGAKKECSWTPMVLPPLFTVTVKAGSSASFTSVCYTNARIGDKITVIVEGETLLTNTKLSVSGTAEILP